MRARPITPAAAVEEFAERIVATAGPGSWTRVLVDGAGPADPAGWADAVQAQVRLRGRPTLRVSAEDFLRPASLRLERGRRDPDAYYADRLDAAALRRAVLAPLGVGGSGRVLPRFWDTQIDRSPRAEPVTLPVGGVLLLDGSLLLSLGLPAELRVHLHLSEAALRRRMSAELAWTLPAYHRYTVDAHPLQQADLVLLVDHPDRPAVLDTAS
ncbi:MAG TPA: uridine kinase [Pseudonocardiaceae bacterium]